MQNGFSETIIGWKSGQTTYVPLRDRMEGAWLWTQKGKLYRKMEAIGESVCQARAVGSQPGGPTE
jgi:hypothetical protein